MDERTIRFDQEEFIQILKQCTDLIATITLLQEKAILIAGPVLEVQTPMANLFYVGPGRETMEQYYTQLAMNISNLNGFYSKACEYLLYVQTELGITDEEIAASILGNGGGN